MGPLHPCVDDSQMLLRSELDSSHARLRKARCSRVQLKEEQHMHEWVAPPPPPDIQAGPAHLAERAAWRDMITALQHYEATLSHGALPPTRVQSFWVTLRGLLNQIVAEQARVPQAARLQAAHAWFSKYRPQQRAGDRALSAALCSSLAVQLPPAVTAAADPTTAAAAAGGDNDYDSATAGNAAMQHLPATSGKKQHGAGRHTTHSKQQRHTDSCLHADTLYMDAIAQQDQMERAHHAAAARLAQQCPSAPAEVAAQCIADPASKQGFLTAFTRATTPPPPSSSVSGSASPQQQADTNAAGSSMLATQQLHAATPSLAHLPIGNTKLATTTVVDSSGPYKQANVKATASADSACNTCAATDQQQKAAGAVPTKLQRMVLFDPDKLQLPAGPVPANSQAKPPSWFQGPYRTCEPHHTAATPVPRPSTLPPKTSGAMHGTAQRTTLMAASSTAIAAARAAAGTVAPRLSQTATAAVKGSQVADEMQAWASQRARLEEEIVRRQEASRYALPSLRNATDHAPVQQTPAASGHGDVSAYAGMTQATYASLAKGQVPIGSGVPDALQPRLGLAPRPRTFHVAQEERASAAAAFAVEVQQIADKVQQFGLGGRLRLDAMLHALQPVPDKPYLACIAALPRPGEQFPARPASVGSKKHGSSAYKARRPASK